MKNFWNRFWIAAVLVCIFLACLGCAAAEELVCDECGRVSIDCDHDNAVIEETVRYEEPVRLCGNRHSVLEVPVVRMFCPDCGHKFTEDIADMDPTNVTYGCTDLDTDEYCDTCGAHMEDAHVGSIELVETVMEQDPEEYDWELLHVEVEELGEYHRIRRYFGYNIYACDVCGEQYSVYDGLNGTLQYDVVEEHWFEDWDYENDEELDYAYCVCGKICDHSEGEVVLDYIEEWTVHAAEDTDAPVAVDNGDGTHTFAEDLLCTANYACSICGRNGVQKEDAEFPDSGKVCAHKYEGGDDGSECLYCDSVCTHPDGFNRYYEGLTQDELVETTESAHVYKGRLGWYLGCPHCCYSGYEYSEESYTYSESHEFEDGSCCICGYEGEEVSACEHNFVSGNEFCCDGAIYIPVSSEIHEFGYWGEAYRTCTLCGYTEYIEDVSIEGEDYFMLYEPHEFDAENGECKKCGYNANETDGCDHENVVYGEEYYWWNDTSDSHKASCTSNGADSHTVRYPVFRDVLCADCGKILEGRDMGTGEIVRYETAEASHSFDRNNICDCGEVSSCLHENTTTETRKIPLGRMDPEMMRTKTHHASIERYEDTVTCDDCGARLSDFCIGEYVIGDFEEHELVDGVCTVCGIDLNCSHKYVAGLCIYCKAECEHASWTESVCDSCGKVCDEHKWVRGACKYCKAVCEHEWNEGTCSICSLPCEHEWNEGVCGICGETECEHSYKLTDCVVVPMKPVDNGDGTHSISYFWVDVYACEYCGVSFEIERDADEDGVTDISTITERHYYDNGVCMECGAKQCSHSYSVTDSVAVPGECEDNGDGTHTLSFIWVDVETCGFCGDERLIERDEDGDGVTDVHTIVEQHYMYDGVCMECGFQAKNCKHEYTETVFAPTCIDDGYTLYVCRICGKRYTDDFVDPLGHSAEIDAAVEPGCVTPGLTEGSHCSVCGELLLAQEEIAPTGHSIAFAKSVYETAIGDEPVKIVLKAACGCDISAEFTVSQELAITNSSDTSITVEAKAACVAEISAVTRDDAKTAADCRMIVHADAQLVLPEELMVIAEGAFAEMEIEEVVLGDKVASIGGGAFANCGELALINLPDDVQIAEDAFDGCDKLTIICSEGSKGQIFAAANGIDCFIQ